MIERLFYLLAAVVEYLKRLARKREQKDAQDDRNELEENPADWFNSEFGGVQRDDNASEADKADPDSDRK